VRAVVARVTRASVRVDDEVVGEITEPGLLVLLGVHRDDVHGDDVHGDGAAEPGKVVAMARKLPRAEAAARRTVLCRRRCAAASWSASSITLYGDTRKGRRPSWSAAAAPGDAEPVVDAVVEALRARGARVETGRFGAMMEVESINDGPYTVLIEV